MIHGIRFPTAGAGVLAAWPGVRVVRSEPGAGWDETAANAPTTLERTETTTQELPLACVN